MTVPVARHRAGDFVAVYSDPIDDGFICAEPLARHNAQLILLQRELAPQMPDAADSPDQANSGLVALLLNFQPGRIFGLAHPHAIPHRPRNRSTSPARREG
jgi:hypothetical protein